MFINSQGQFYVGDMQPVDREATAEEVAAWDASRAQAEVAAKLAKVREVRELYLGRILGIKDAARDAGDTATVDACKVARQSLLGITEGLLQMASEDIDGVVLQRYQAIVAACTPQMVDAFALVDA